MAATNLDRVGRALTAVRDGIRPGLVATWEAAYGDDWIDRVNGADAYPEWTPSVDDLAFLLKGMGNTWNAIFKDQFGHAERNYVSELRETRNAWAHNEAFSSDDTYRVLDTSERLLTAFSAADQVIAVQGMKQGLLRQRYEKEAANQQRRLATEPTKGEPKAGLTPWREVMTPHVDVREGRYQQAEFAADLHQVAFGNADAEYGDPADFYRRTFITEGMKSLLVNAVRRFSGTGGDPVVGLQTNFGGGKTHSLIALYHLASGAPAADLPGVAELLHEAGVELPGVIRRAVVVGQMISPALVHAKPDGTEVRTLWGEIAWQLGGAGGYAMLAETDREAKNPGAQLIRLFERYGPALVLLDEWVAYVRQLPDRGVSNLPAGDFDTHFTFAQTLTEAASSVDNVLVVASAPESANEVGGERGQLALAKLENVVFRKALRWQPASADESFEIVRRRLFEPMAPDQAKVRNTVVRAFHDMYRESNEFPGESREEPYRRRMEAAYPIHPELFERLYSDWSTLERFQRTRGVLRLMASVISELWRRDDRSLLIMPGTLPMDADPVVSELTQYLDDKWDPIIRSDVDGPNSLPLRVDSVPAIGKLSGGRRVARTVYLGSAPRAEGRRGVDQKRILLGVTQPGEPTGVFVDALRRLSSDATYLYVEGSQYWYSPQPNVTRIAKDRADAKTDDEADAEIQRRIEADRARGPFGAVHVFPDGPGDIPDDADQVRLVILSPFTPHTSNDMAGAAVVAAGEILDQRQGGPRINRNLLVFLAAESGNRVAEVRASARSYLAWKSIVTDKGEDRLNLNPQQVAQAEAKLAEADDTVGHRIREAYQLVLTPTQDPRSADIVWHQTRATASGSLAERSAKKLESEEKLIASYAGIRVRMDLDRVPLWDERGDIGIRRLWGYYAQYPYLPRLAGFDTLTRAISDGVARTTWASETFAYAEAFDEETGRYRGLEGGHHVAVGSSASALLVKPERARAQLEEVVPVRPKGLGGELPIQPGAGPSLLPDRPVYRRFYGRTRLDPVRAIRDLEAILDNVAQHLSKAGGDVEITIEVDATGEGFDDAVRRVVSENSTQLHFDRHEFEE